MSENQQRASSANALGKPRVLFLDFDGVINDHLPHENGYCGSRSECVSALNRVLCETGAKIVVTSAWRYLVLTGSMTLKGLENLLLTHGLDVHDRLIGHTRADIAPDRSDRGQQIAEWLKDHNQEVVYVVVDDLDLEISDLGHPFVQTDGGIGLTDDDAFRLIYIFTEAMVVQ